MTSSGLSKLDWAALSARGISDTRGVLGRPPPLPASDPWIPGWIELEGEDLVSSRHVTAGPVRDTEGMLGTFLRIKSPQGVLRFARRFGVLRLCKHGLPSTHPPSPSQFRDSVTGLPLPFEPCRPIGWTDSACREPLDLWFWYVARATAILRVAVALDGGKMPSKQDWETMLAGWRVELSTNPADNRHQLAMTLAGWLSSGNVTLGLDWSDGWPPTVRLYAETFGILAIQLATAISKKHVAVCSGCSLPYPREKRPQTGRRNFCDDCGEKIASRLRKRDQRERGSRRRKRR